MKEPSVTDAARRRELKAAYKQRQGIEAGRRPAAIGFVAALLVLAGMAMLLVSQALTMATGATREWPLVEATVVDSQVAASRHFFQRGGGNAMTYTPRLSYRYTFEGQPYESSRLRVCDLFNGESHRPYAEAVLRDRQPGASLKVRVWPRYPSVAVLDGEDAPPGTEPMLFGVLLIALGVIARFARPARSGPEQAHGERA